ncbi:unnamed protein product [Caenorhabditis auriculariae]|uniref:Vacuolar protein sorting-associated protein 13 n=1 Tax=Caenorhabditis auriculariae TaxID=2777116 RepID=A0A8S1GYZ2_9PELO|nr:unnamed protein product [Caenorhabditis auriculariae]
MVFESLVADLLNRFLGDFVDNLDSSQLNIGIWGGDVKLENLQVKETALDDLDLPVKLKFGYLSSLILKIPWKNLYKEPVIATIDGLNLIVVPNKGVVYSEDKAMKNTQEVKQKTLDRLEQARKDRRKPKNPESDTFAEKMVAQIIKNLQVSISNIHVRFEDKYTNRHRPFAMGITLKNLEFKTTDENWRETIHKETVKIIYKLVSLENLAVYWNSDSELISDLEDKEQIRRKLQETIHDGKNVPKGYKYILEPIKMQAKLKLNQKPETDGSNWSIPKIDLGVDMQALALAIGKFQYQDVLLFLEAQERFQTAGQYLKYRPHLNEYKGHYKTWWKFAYTSILEEKVRRRRNNWSWSRMKAHRELVKNYQQAWVKHQTESSPGGSVTEIVKEAEKKLDVFNLNVARQQAELEIDRKELTRLEDKPQGWVAWGKSWFGGSGGRSGEKKDHKDITSQLQEAITPEEKAKLFEAIDYQENIPPTNYPKEYIENKFEFKLGQVAIVVDGALSLQLLHLKANVEQRPSAAAMNVCSSIQEFRMDGCGTEILRVRDTSVPWMMFMLDTNPLKGGYDQLVKLAISPVNIKYHAPAFNSAIDVFKPPESVRLNQLTTLAMSRYEEVKARSATGLAHAVENRSKLELDVQIHPARIFISEGGVYNPEKPTLLADLGLLTIVTTTQNVNESVKTDRLQSLMEQAYDRFHVKLSNVVISLAENVALAEESVHQKESRLHVLKPTGLDIELHKSSIDDLRLAKMRIIGNLPDIVVAISDQRLLMLMKLLLSIPKPEADPETKAIQELQVPAPKIKDRAKMRTIMEVEEIEEDDTQKETEQKDKKTSEQQVQVELDLKLHRIGIIVDRHGEVLCDLSVLEMACKLQMRTFDMVVTAELGSLQVSMPSFNSLDEKRKYLYLIDNVEEHGALMQLKFVQANPESPFFATEYRSTEQYFEFKFRSLNVSLHQEGVLELKKFGEELQAKINELQEKTPEEDRIEEQAKKISRKLSDSLASVASLHRQSSQTTSRSRRSTRRKESAYQPENVVVKMRVNASFDRLGLLLGNSKATDTKLAIKDIETNVRMTEKKTEVDAKLKAIVMNDCTPGAVYKKLLHVTGDEDMLRFNMTQHQRTDSERASMNPTDVDMFIKIRLAQLRFVFLNLWLCRLMAWIAPFQAEAVRAAQAAQEAAAEKAATAAQNVKQMMEESPPRIALDVLLEAPHIVVPRDSRSLDVVVLHLGKILVQNKIVGDKEFRQAVLDRMDIKLTDINFGIGVMNQEVTEVTSTCAILKPLTFTLAVQRNLTFKIAKDLPEVVVDAHLNTIEAEMSESDYETLMQMLNGNLAEGSELIPPPPPPPTLSGGESTTQTAPVVATPKSPGADSKAPKKDREADAGPPPVEHPKPRIVFHFALDKISAILYDADATPGVRDERHAFASLQLQNLKLSGKIGEDNAQTIAISLDAFTMNDERKDKTKVQHLMDKKGKDDERFLDLNFKQDSESNKQIRLKMTAFFICLNPEFLGCLTRFFTVPPTEEQREREEMMAKQQTPKTGPAQKPSGTIDQAGTITVDCDMHGVEVIVIEDPLNPETSQALILSFNVNINAQPKVMFHEVEAQRMSGAIENLTIFSSYYAEHRRKEITYEVLKPVNIQVLAHIRKTDKSTDAVLKMGDMELRMSPAIIRLLSAVSSEFSKSSAVDYDKSEGKVPAIKRNPDYWLPKIIDQRKYWFFTAPLAEEATEEDDDDEKGSKKLPMATIEKARLEFNRINFTLEAGTGAIPVPLIFLDMLVTAEAENWTSALKSNAAISIQMSYYNEALSVWEPIIEPVETEEGRFERWDLRMTVKGKGKNDLNESTPAMDIKIDADKMLNVTITKSFFGLSTKLAELFATAAKQTSPTKTRQLPGISPFVVLNESGVAVKILDSDTIKVSDSGQPIDATHGSFVDLHLKTEKREKTELERLSVDQTEVSADLRLDLLDTVRETKIGRAGKRAIPLPKVSAGGHKWMIIAETTIENGRRLVTLTSHVKVTNHMDFPMEIYSKHDTRLDLFGVIEPQQTMHLAVPLLYSPTGEIYLKPADEKYEVSFESLSWHSFEHDKRQAVRCNVESDENFQGLYIDTVVHEEKIPESLGSEVSTFHMHLYPPLDFYNVLPMDVTLEAPEKKTVVAGTNAILNVVTDGTIKMVVDYLNEPHTLEMRVPTEKKDLVVVKFVNANGGPDLLLGLHWTTEYGVQKLYLYAPFWVVNNTSKTLRHTETSGNALSNTARGCVPCGKKSAVSTLQNEEALLHLPDSNPIILPYPTTDLAKKKKARVKIEGESDWSTEFPLDTVGNAAMITCKGQGRDYDMTVDIKLCQSGLTKIVTFAPFYLISNLGKFPIEVREDAQNFWTEIPGETCVGVWPIERGKKKLMCARYKGEKEESLLFPITENIETLCHIDSDVVGLEVSVSTGEASVAVHISPFQPGMAPCLVMNNLNVPVTFGQRGYGKKTVKSNEMAMFTWSNIVAPRLLEVSAGDWHFEDKMDQNKFGDVQIDKNVRRFCYYSVFLAGRQRILLLTADLDIARSAYGSWETDNVDLQAEISLQGFGLSVVDNVVGREIIYMAISSSDILWEEEIKKGRFRPLAVKHMQELEEKYQKHLVSPNNEFEAIDTFEVNMATMIIKKKKGKEAKLRRIFGQGVWANYGKSAQRTRLHAKINHIQIDNQLDACVFPRILAVVPPPKSVVVDNTPKPFVELSLLQRQPEFSSVAEIEYGHALIQEFSVQVDQGLINAFMQFLAGEVEKKPYGVGF